jgi:hypothetical protein
VLRPKFDDGFDRQHGERRAVGPADDYDVDAFQPFVQRRVKKA